MSKLLKNFFYLAAVLMLVFAIGLMAAENGQNKFVKVFGAKMPDIDRTAWQVNVLPDWNDNGVDEVLVSCDAEDGSNGADFYIWERTDNNEHKVVWHYRAADCANEYGAGFGDVDNDGQPELILCLNVAAGQSGLVFFETDPTLPGYPLPAEPTSMIDLGEGLGYDIDGVAVADLDKDDKNEMIVLVRTNPDRGVWVLEEQNGDIAFPDFKLEAKLQGFSGSPWSIVIGDFDNDGLTDFAVGEYDYSGLYVYENVEPDSYKVQFHAKFTMGAQQDGVALRSLGAYDFNNDGFAELVYPTSADTGVVYIITNPGELALMDSTNVHPVAMIKGGCAGAAIGDQDWTGAGSDGRDIYVAGHDSTIYDIEYIGGTDGDVGDPANWVVYKAYKGPYSWQDVAVGDFDRDGRREVVGITKDKTNPQTIVYIEHEPLPNFGAEAVWHDPSKAEDPTDPIIGNPRGFWVGSDVDQDGKKEIIATQYPGILVVYEVAGDNTLEMVWMDSTAKPICTGASEPRHVIVGDIDGNGKMEIIAHMGNSVASHPDSVGFWFFEWNGQDNGFGLTTGGPTFILPTKEIDPTLTSSNGTEYIWMDDVDGDGDAELLFPCDGSPNTNDMFIILSCVDGTLDSGFPVFKTELTVPRGAVGDFNGSPKGAMSADLNGDGVKEAIFLPWDIGKVVFAQAVKPDSFVWRTVQVDRYHGVGDDGVFFTSIGAYDVDKDGSEELMGAMYNTAGRVFLLNFPSTGIADFDPMNPDHVSLIRPAVGSAPFNNVLDDLNGDGVPELFFCNYSRGQVNALSYNGVSDPKDAASWITSEGFYDNSFVPKPKRAAYPDSASHAKALKEWNDGDISQIHGSFGLKFGHDIDDDGKNELVISSIQSFWSDTWLWVLEPTKTGVKAQPWRVINPSDYKLSQNYPNPFNATTSIEYVLPLDKQVKVMVYNTMGQVVRTLVDKVQPQGAHRVIWNGMNDAGQPVATGLYLYSLEVGNFKQVKRMTLVK